MENVITDARSRSEVPYTEEQVDQAFAHLEELFERLPVIREKDARLARAREARELLQAKEARDRTAAEIVEYEAIRTKALEAAKLASDKGDKEAEGRNLAVLRMYADLHISRLASAQRAENALFVALKEGSLTLGDPLGELALDDDEYAALEAELLTYQADYTATYESCLCSENLHKSGD
ncbi:MAG TPA: hypothetical protein DEB24_06930 [Coriobacteriia bacterium]|nr:hypothetical protein [Coriobacteriia bacterium]